VSKANRIKHQDDDGSAASVPTDATSEGSDQVAEASSARSQLKGPSAGTVATALVVVCLPLAFFCFFVWLGAYDLGACVTEAAALCFPVCLVLWLVSRLTKASHERASGLTARMAHLLYWVALTLFVVGEVIALAQTAADGADISLGLFNGIVYGVAALSVVLQVVSSILARRGFSSAEVAHKVKTVSLVLSIVMWWAPALVVASVVGVLAMAVA
jgi:hypothetical protein